MQNSCHAWARQGLGSSTELFLYAYSVSMCIGAEGLHFRSLSFTGYMRTIIIWNLIQVCIVISIATGVSPLVLRELTPSSH